MLIRKLLFIKIEWSVSFFSFLHDKVDEMWLPDRIQIFDHFPRTSMGKIKKYLLIKQIFDFTYELSDSSSVDGE